MLRGALQILGSLLILAAFAGAQRRMLSTESRLYLVFNLVGAAILGVEAAVPRLQPGFLLLEACWVLVAAAGLLQSRRRTRKDPSDRRD